MIHISTNMCISGETLQALVDDVYDNILNGCNSIEYIVAHVILTPTNAIVDDINNFILDCFPGQHCLYHSADSIIDSTQMNIYPTEFLNKQSPSNCLLHELIFF